MSEMVPRDQAEWRIIYDATWGMGFAYKVQYRLPGREWKEWTSCDTRWGARFALWRAKRISKPIGGVMLIHEDGRAA